MSDRWWYVELIIYSIVSLEYVSHCTNRDTNTGDSYAMLGKGFYKIKYVRSSFKLLDYFFS